MDYNQLTKVFSEQLKINHEIFQFNLLNEKVIHEDINLKMYERHKAKSSSLTAYQYIENTNEDWQGIVLYFDNHHIPQVLKVLNSFLKAEKQVEVDSNNISKGFSYTTNSHILLLGKVKNNQLEIHLTRTKN